MRHGTTNRRQRNRTGSNRRGGQQKMQVFDSNGPDVRIRGTAHQITEKYLTLAKDAASSGDRTLAENYLQHAEHYQRVINSWVQEETANEPAKEKQNADGNKASKNNDDEAELGLPASIIGDGAKVEVKERTDEATA